MGENMSKKYVKKSKKESSVNHLVKVLKPRVYITHPSNFKSLVQELTGNATASSPSPTSISSQYLVNNQCSHRLSYTPGISLQSSISSDIVSQPTDDQQIQLMLNNIIVDQDCYYGVRESSPQWSFERSCSEIINVPFTTCDAWSVSEDLSMSAQILSDGIIEQFHSSLFGSHEDLSVLRCGDGVEYSWISEMNNPFVYDHEATIMPVEVCEYAYDLSGLL